MEEVQAPWLANLLAQSHVSSKAVQPHVPRRMQTRRLGKQFQGGRKVKWRRFVAKGQRVAGPEDRSERAAERSMAASTVPLVTPPATSATSRRKAYSTSRISARGRKGSTLKKLEAQTNDDTNESSLDAKQLYLLNQFLGFDKFTGREREDLVDLMVDRWLTDPFVGDEYRQHIELYCESSYSMTRGTSKVEFPNRLNTAVCCDLLTLIARKDSKYRRALKLIKSGIFASIFSDYKEADEDGRTFLEMMPFYTKVSHNKKQARKEKIGYTSIGTDSELPEIEEGAQIVGRNRQAELVQCLSAASPEYVAETIEQHLEEAYCQRMKVCWQMSGKRTGEAQFQGQIDSYEQKFQAMNEKMKAMEEEIQELQSKLDTQTLGSSDGTEDTSDCMEEARHISEASDSSTSKRIPDAEHTIILDARSA